jgi:hypothetical protein
MVSRAMVSSSSTPPPPPIIGNSILMQPMEKLTKANHAVWYAHVHASIRGAKLMGYLTGQSKSPPSEIPQVGANGKKSRTTRGRFS